MRQARLALVLGALVSGQAVAGPADYVYMPTVEYGEREIDFKYGTAEQRPDDERKQTSMLGFGYGATEYWFTEIYLKREREGSERLTLGEWENKFQLTETGKYPFELGLLAEIEVPFSDRGSTPYEFKLGPLLQTDVGRVQLNGNLLFERKVGPNDGDESYKTEMGYQWQVKYRWQPAFEFGAQGFGEMGEWNHWESSNAQSHRLGPAAFGKINLGNKQALKWNAAWLFGTTSASLNNNFRMQAEYEF